MDPTREKETEDTSIELAEDSETASISVDDFIRELEKKEKDLHITSETTFIEIASDFDDDEIPDFLQEDLARTEPVTEGSDAKASNVDIKRLEDEVKRLEKETDALKAKISDLQEERTELYKNAQRRLKDFEAFKARTERERGETFQRQLSNLATQMLPALDNLDRALNFASEMPEEERNGFTQFFDGIVLVNQQVNEVLGEMGIVPIASVGEPFDPELHEAVAIDERSDLAPNTITAELLRGFRIGDIVIRHSMVRVSTAPPQNLQEIEEDKAEESEENSPESENGIEATHRSAPEENLSSPEQENATACLSDKKENGPDQERASDTETDDRFEIERNGEVATHSSEHRDDE